jgi:hypothetical protein
MPPTWEKRGAKNLSKPDGNRSRGRLHVRIYYCSEGNDLLCFDTCPMTTGAVEFGYPRVVPLDGQ